jgi:cell division protein FtsI/penicillin-binding protein 2
MKLDLQKGSRTRVLAIVIVAVASIFVVRLFYLQVMQYGYFTNVAKATQEKRFIIPASRGEIYALDGSSPVRLVMNQTVYTVFADPKTVKEPDAIAKTLREVAGGNLEPNLEARLKADNRYQRLATKLTASQRDKIKDKNYNGVAFQAETQRVYPEGQMASQILGFVNNDGDGNYGVEGYMNAELRGEDGALQAVTDVRDVPLTIGRNNVRVEPKNGTNVVLSIDRSVQMMTEEALAKGLERTGATRGSVTVIDPQTGRVMAMASAPTFKPAEYNKVTDVAQFNNLSLAYQYEPGSDIKPFTMAAAINEGAVKPSDTYVNTDTIKVGDRTIGNATKGHTGTIPLQEAIRWSLNTGSVTTLMRMGNGSEITQGARDKLYDYFHNRFGFGERTGIELSGEAKGIIVSPKDLDGNAVRYSNMSFGQGFEATQVQVTAAFASLINGGNYYKPTVISGAVDGNGIYKPAEAPKPLRQTISADTSRQITGVLQYARQLYLNRDKPGYVIGGKTGTSQVIRDGVYADDESVATYLGFGGNSKSARYVIMVTLGGDNKVLKGEQDAMPVFTELSNKLIDHLRITPN